MRPRRDHNPAQHDLRQDRATSELLDLPNAWMSCDREGPWKGTVALSPSRAIDVCPGWRQADAPLVWSGGHLRIAVALDLPQDHVMLALRWPTRSCRTSEWWTCTSLRPL